MQLKGVISCDTWHCVTMGDQSCPEIFSHSGWVTQSVLDAVQKPSMRTT